MNLSLIRKLTLSSLIALTAIFTATLISTSSAAAQGGQPTDNEVNAIAKQLYCPVCENIPLDVCPTKACEDWREEIRLMLSQGKSEQEIKEYFVVRYGDRVLATPPAKGINWLIYVVPPAAILIGAYILLRAFQSWKQSGPPQPPEEITPPADEYIARLEEELRKQ